MLLTFSRLDFVDKICGQKKIHTIRADKKFRWKQGMTIQFWFGNPRNTRGKDKPYQFAEGICNMVVDININNQPNNRHVICQQLGGVLNNAQVDLLAEMDGFNNTEEFWEWFNEPNFKGRLIFWAQPITLKQK